jgi:hypothetical protein
MAIAFRGLQDRMAYPGGTSGFNEFRGSTMPITNAPPLAPAAVNSVGPASMPMTAAPTNATRSTSLSSLAAGLPSMVSMLGGAQSGAGSALKPKPTYGASLDSLSGAMPSMVGMLQSGANNGGSSLAPLQGQDLADLQHTVLTGQYNGDLANRLGSSYNAYVNMYGPSGQLWGQTRNAYADAPGGGGNAFAPAGAAPMGGGAAGGGSVLPVGGGSGAAPGMPHGDNFGGAGGGSGNVDWSNLDVNKFLDPSLAYRENEAANVISNGAAARGNLLSGSTQKAIADRVSGMAGDAYTQALQASMADRTFGRGVFTDNRNFGEGQRQFNTNFGENQRQFNNNFGEGQRRFDTGVDQADRAFDYNAQVGDRNFNYTRLSDLAHMGLNGTQGQAALQQALAQLTATLGMTNAQVGAAGAQGANSAITQMISQILAQINGNHVVNAGNGGP